MNDFAELMHVVSRGFETTGVLIIIAGLFMAVYRAILRVREGVLPQAYETVRATFGRAVLLGLEVLVAADIIRTVAVEPTMANLQVLALLVAVRTFLAWSLEVEIEGRWPWQRGRS